MTVLQDPRPPLPSPPSPSQSPTKQEVQQGLRPALGKGGNSRTQADSGSESTAASRAAPHLVGSLPSAGQARVSRGVLGAPGPCDSWLTLPASLQRALSCPLLQARLQMVSGAGSRSSRRAAALPGPASPAPSPPSACVWGLGFRRLCREAGPAGFGVCVCLFPSAQLLQAHPRC